MTCYITPTRVLLVLNCFIHYNLTHNSNFKQIMAHNKIKYRNNNNFCCLEITHLISICIINHASPQFYSVLIVPLINCCNTAMLKYSSMSSWPIDAMSNAIPFTDLYTLPLYSPIVGRM